MSARSYNINNLKKQGNIRVTRDDKGLTVRLHNTDVLNKQGATIKLNSGGWLTVTTKTAINNGLQQLGSNLRVIQKKGTWYVSCNEKGEILFNDNMTLILDRG